VSSGFEAVPGFSAARRRRRQQLIWTIIRSVIAAFLFFLCLGASYHVGQTQGETEVRRLVDDLALERDRSRELTATIAGLEHQSEQRIARSTAQQQQRVRRWSSELEKVMALADTKLAEGVSSERMGRALAILTRDRRCEQEVETKRVLVRTPTSREGGTLSFAGGKMQASFRGAAARNPAGRVESWYDMAQPIEVSLAPSGQTTPPISGIVPFEHGFVIDRRENIVAIRPSERRGQVEVQLRVCDYP